MNLVRLFAILLMLTVACLNASADDGVDYQKLVDQKLWITEHYPPYHYFKDDAIDGIVIRILDEVFRRNNLTFDPQENFHVFPWARALKELSTNPEAVIVSMGYTQERSQMYRLSRPVFTETIGLITLDKRDLQLDSFSQLSNYFIGAVRDDIGERLLKDMVTEPLNLVHVQTSDELLELLLLGRVDMIAYSQHIIDYQINRKSLSRGDFTILKVLQEVPATLAFNREGETVLFELIDQTIATMQQDGTIDMLIRQYDK